MKIFLAGCEYLKHCHIARIINYPNILFSYYHWSNNNERDQQGLFEILREQDFEVICDSGLFTLMFGAGAGRSYDLPFMKQYTDKYLASASRFGIKKLTIVESDVHKLLGMDAVFELRKKFEDSGLQVMYVWHKEEGLDGLFRMAEKYNYIALSVPELRILFKGKQERYQTIVQQLLQQIRSHVGADKMPKIHLLGNTVHETMETTLAYSCDSTSWISGVKFGRVFVLKNNRVTSVHTSSDSFKAWCDQILPSHKEYIERLHDGRIGYKFEYHKKNLCSAIAYKRYQEYLDRKYTWIGAQK